MILAPDGSPARERARRPALASGLSAVRLLDQIECSRRIGNSSSRRNRVPGRSGSSLLNVLSLGPAVWLRSDLGITLGTGVSAWADQSGNGVNVTQATGANQPVYNAADAAYNNRPSLQSTAVNMSLASIAFTLIAQPFCVFLIGEGSTSGGELFGSQNTSAPQIFNNAGNTSAFAGAALTNAVAMNTPRAFLATFNGASGFVGASNWLTGGTTGNVGATGISQLGILNVAAGSAGCVGKVLEFILLPRLPTAGDKTSLAAYFQTLYGLTVT